MLSEADRSTENSNQSSIRCDQQDLVPGWYRFQGDAGDRMPENQCVPKLRCGSHAPGWLNGSHPAVSEGAVQRKVCYHWGSNCCQWSNTIRVRNCGDFFVYELQKPPVCSLRYCGNAGGNYYESLAFVVPSSLLGFDPTPFGDSSMWFQLELPCLFQSGSVVATRSLCSDRSSPCVAALLLLALQVIVWFV